METIRSEFHNITDKESLYAFLDKFEESSCDQAEPYIASALMKKGQYAFFPTTKMKYFNAGKDRLEKYVTEHPTNLEAKYMRLMVQKRIPNFLNYSENIQEDSLAIVNNLAESKLSASYQKLILQNITNQS